jgi:hypothetical protein
VCAGARLKPQPSGFFLLGAAPMALSAATLSELHREPRLLRPALAPEARFTAVAPSLAAGHRAAHMQRDNAGTEIAQVLDQVTLGHLSWFGCLLACS